MDGEYYKTQESVEEYIRLADGYNGQQLIEKLKLVLPEASSVLEIGSGPGTDWKILSESYDVAGSDYSPVFLNHLIGGIPGGEFLELDAITLITDRKFDGIYSNKVLHHLKDDELAASIKRQHEILLPHGIICHSFWKGEGSEIFKGLYVNYHNERELKEFHKEHFDILSIESYREFEDGDSLLLIAKRK